MKRRSNAATNFLGTLFHSGFPLIGDETRLYPLLQIGKQPCRSLALSATTLVSEADGAFPGLCSLGDHAFTVRAERILLRG